MASNTSISLDLDTMEEVRYKMRSFLVGEPTKTNVLKAPSTGCVNLVSAATHIPAYRLFETKRYNGTLGPPGTPGTPGTPVPKALVVGGRNPQCCICLDEIKKNCMIVSMPLCGHIYHKACLFNWVDLSKNTFCPYCKQDDF